MFCPPRLAAVGFVFLTVALSGAFPARSLRAASFVNDVMPVLSRAGCNTGKCHGNRHGKGGLKLSLRGEDPLADYQALVTQRSGRRVNHESPAQSLLLRKPTREIGHGGGQRFASDSLEYQLLYEWIAAGTPEPSGTEKALQLLNVSPSEAVIIDRSLQLTAQALYDDGSVRDVTQLAVFESTSASVEIDRAGVARSTGPGSAIVLVRFLDQQVPARLDFLDAAADFVWRDLQPFNFIDEYVLDRLRRIGIQPAPLSDDATFVRRVYLDVLGIPPTGEEARRFVEDQGSDKRALLIDELLQRSEFSTHWALKWGDLLRCEEKSLDPTGAELFHAWIVESFQQNKPLDLFIREIVSARGSTYEQPPANFWRALRDPLLRGEATAQVFLGVRLQCAKCHDHPYDRWTQDAYYSWAAAFEQIDYEIIENKRVDKLDKHEFVGEQIVHLNGEHEVVHARTNDRAQPRMLGSDQSPERDASDRLEEVASWLTDPDNELFARVQANRIWYQLMGRGIVEPVDDFRATNPPSVPGLLETLADEFARSGFDVRHLVRTIMLSRTYQLSAIPDQDTRMGEGNFAHAIVRRLSAEQLLDAQCQLLGVPAEFNGYDDGTRASQLAGVDRVHRRKQSPAAGDRFLRMFGKPARLLCTDCERSSETNLSQAMLLVGGEGLHQRLEADDSRLAELADSERDDRQVVDSLYWEALSRPPRQPEREACMELLTASSSRREALEDIVWALLNSKEFTFRH